METDSDPLRKILQQKNIVVTIPQISKFVDKDMIHELYEVKDNTKAIVNSTISVTLLIRKIKKKYPDNHIYLIKWLWDYLSDKQLIEQVEIICDYIDDKTFNEFRDLTLHVCNRISNTFIVTNMLSKLVVYAIESKQLTCFRYLLSNRLSKWNLKKLTETALVTAISTRYEEVVDFIRGQKLTYLFPEGETSQEELFQKKVMFVSYSLIYNDIPYYLKTRKLLECKTEKNIQNLINNYIFYIEAFNSGSTELAKFILKRLQFDIKNILYVISRASVEAVKLTVDEFKDHIRDNEDIIDALVKRNNYEIAKPIYDSYTCDIIHTSVIVYLADNLICMINIDDDFDLGVYLSSYRHRKDELTNFIKKFISYHGTKAVSASYIITLEDPEILSMYNAVTPVDFFKSRLPINEIYKQFNDSHLNIYEIRNLVKEFDNMIQTDQSSYAKSAIIAISRTNCVLDAGKEEMEMLLSTYPSWVNMAQELLLEDNSKSIVNVIPVNSVVERRKLVDGLTICSICREELKPRQKQLKPRCGHACHFNCITKWFQLSGHHSCPLCRNHILFDIEKI